ncbi:MAG: (2Fe-2S)-binding protein [Acidimicrobiales bacterium]|nr:(2Fe-2S)-binding protein [Acidimicrobiales bacterium]
MVCHCRAVGDRAIRAAVAAGAGDVEAVASTTTAGSDCGGCHQAILELLAEAAGSRARATSSAA